MGPSENPVILKAAKGSFPPQLKDVIERDNLRKLGKLLRRSLFNALTQRRFNAIKQTCRVGHVSLFPNPNGLPTLHTVNFLTQFLRVDASHRTGDVINETLILTRLPEKYVPQHRGLSEVVLFELAAVADYLADPSLMLMGRSRYRPVLASSELDWAKHRANVVRVVSIVVAKVHEAVSLIRAVDCAPCSVGREQLVVCAQTIPGSVGVCEHASLEHYDGISVAPQCS